MSPDEELEQLKAAVRKLTDHMQQTLLSGGFLSQEVQVEIAGQLRRAATRIGELKEVIRQREEAATQEALLGTAPSADMQLLWQLAGGDPQAFIHYLRTFPGADTQGLLGNPNELNRIITILTHRFPKGERPVVDGIPHADLQSSNVWGAKYDPHSRKMLVRFNSGSEYAYDGVPPWIWQAFIHGNASAKTQGKNEFGEWWVGKNPSLGAALHQYIKAASYPYRRLK